jgi:hypothetical protein
MRGVGEKRMRKEVENIPVRFKRSTCCSLKAMMSLAYILLGHMLPFPISFFFPALTFCSHLNPLNFFFLLILIC